MSESACVLCGEPWETSHIRHDEPMYVQQLYFAGKGCPSCEGRRQRRKSEAKVLAVGGALMQEEDDVQERLEMLADGRDELDYSKEWQEAANKDHVVKTCEGCGERAFFDADDVYGYHRDGELLPAVYVWHERRFSALGDREIVPIKDLVEGTVANGHAVDLTHFDEDWDFTEVAGHTVCRKCHTTCDGETADGESCEAVLFTGDAHSKFVGDTYDPGSSFYVQDLGRYGKTFCSDCFERLPSCGHCGEHWDFGRVRYVGEDGVEPEGGPLGYDVVFIVEDEHKCQECTDWRECPSCGKWREPESFIRVFYEDGVQETEEEDDCRQCRTEDE